MTKQAISQQFYSMEFALFAFGYVIWSSIINTCPVDWYTTAIAKDDFYEVSPTVKELRSDNQQRLLLVKLIAAQKIFI